VDHERLAGPAHLIPVSTLVLDTAGRQGVRHVLPDGRVAFAPVTVQEETPQGMWVSGLNGSVRVITVGQSFVADGQKVRVALAR
jgi:multidrug efflux system membrane fusion protein